MIRIMGVFIVPHSHWKVRFRFSYGTSFFKKLDLHILKYVTDIAGFKMAPINSYLLIRTYKLFPTPPLRGGIYSSTPLNLG